MRGVDVSHWNTGVNLAHGIDFCIVKLTEGTQYTDGMARSFLEQTRKIPRGVYHFATNDNKPEMEAEFFYYQMKDLDLIGRVLPVLDYEVVNPNDREFCERFMKAFYNLAHIWPVLYTSASWLKKFNGSWIPTKCPLWVAGYPKKRTGWPENTNIPYDIAPWTHAIIWQFTSSLMLNGYRPLDGDIAYISPEQWAALARGENQTNYTPLAGNLSKIADEVIAGKWGNGTARKIALERAGYDSARVQALVNEKLMPKAKSIDELAREVIAGKWGNGATRKNALTGAGYDYRAVQARVNELLR